MKRINKIVVSPKFKVVRKIFLHLSIYYLLLTTISLYSQSIVNTVHNLSVSGPGTIKATTETEICIFCHTPHNSTPQTPLWNKSKPGSTYILYSSSTEKAISGQPDGASILCLSCHDGTIALGNVLSRTTPINFSLGITKLPTGKTNLTTDLSDDHPISFIYDAALATADGQIKDPASLTKPVTLENNKVQCTSCHDPHQNIYNNFLVETNQSSNLCLYCHQQNYWNNTTHNTSNKTWNGLGISPWLHTPYTTVSQNACENCHNPHNAGGKKYLRNYSTEEDNCFYCHNGNVAAKNIQTQFTKTYRHDVYSYNLVHEPDENALLLTEHVECEDCHNPHASNSSTSTAPNVNGFTLGVKGIDKTGNPVNPSLYQYEICFRCHTNTANQPGPPTTRQVIQGNLQLEFDLSNPSFHPVEGVGRNNNVPSLINPYTISSIIYCTDCHSSDGSGSPTGPHGSIYPRIMKYQYVTADNTSESPSNYALCYSCHSRNSILSDNTFSYHNKHITDLYNNNLGASCNICHDPHGVSNALGGTANNTKLINFNTSIVSANGGNLKFVDGASGNRYCLLMCHGVAHDNTKYY